MLSNPPPCSQGHFLPWSGMVFLNFSDFRLFPVCNLYKNISGLCYLNLHLAIIAIASVVVISCRFPNTAYTVENKKTQLCFSPVHIASSIKKAAVCTVFFLPEQSLQNASVYGSWQSRYRAIKPRGFSDTWNYKKRWRGKKTNFW